MNEGPTDDQVLAWIQESGVSLEARPEDYATRLGELGVDSLDFFGILEYLEDRTGVVISDDDVDLLRSIADIGVFLRAKITE